MELARFYHYENPDSSLYFAREAITYFERANSPQGKASALWRIYLHFESKGNLKSAKEALDRRASLARQIKDTMLLSSTLTAVGANYFYHRDYPEAMTNFLEALELAESVGNTKAAGTNLLNMGAIQQSIEQNEQAIKYYIQAEKKFAELGYEDELSIIFHNLGAIFHDMGRLGKAESYFEKAKDIENNKPLTPEYIITLTSLTDTQLDLKKVKKAGENAFLALKLAREFNEVSGLIYAYQALADYYSLGKSDSDSANYYFTLAINLAEKQESPRYLEALFTELYDFNKKHGRYEKALEYQERFYALKDSLSGEEAKAKLNALSLKYEADKKDAENALLKSNAKQDADRRQALWIIFSLAAGLLLTIVIFLIFTNRRISKYSLTIQEQNKELAKVNEKLEELNEEKGILMGIVAHDLKAPLSKAEGLANLVSMTQEMDAEGEKMMGLMGRVFIDGKKLIDELVLLTSLENNQEELQLAPEDLKLILEECVSSFSSIAESKQIEISFTTALANAPLQSKREYLLRILDNLVSNALKFSEPGTQVSITLSGDKEQWRVSVKDQGPGISPGDKEKIFKKFARLSAQPTAGESSTGLGLSIAHNLTTLLGGSIEVQSELGTGAEFILRFPSSVS